MIKFVALFVKNADILCSRELYIRHVEHLRKLKKKGRLLLCGPFKDNNEVIQILKADSYKEAEQYIHLDPFVSEGIFLRYVLHELNEATEENNYLLNG
jgi:uncharacterized protein YciI